MPPPYVKSRVNFILAPEVEILFALSCIYSKNAASKPPASRQQPARSWPAEPPAEPPGHRRPAARGQSRVRVRVRVRGKARRGRGPLWCWALRRRPRRQPFPVPARAIHLECGCDHRLVHVESLRLHDAAHLNGCEELAAKGEGLVGREPLHLGRHPCARRPRAMGETARIREHTVVVCASRGARSARATHADATLGRTAEKNHAQQQRGAWRAAPRRVRCRGALGWRRLGGVERCAAVRFGAHGRTYGL